MRVDILSLFPSYFHSPLETSILKRAQEKELLQVGLIDIRTFALGKHAKVDDRPYGGGPGMVLMPGPVCKAIRSVKQEKSHVIYLSPQGTPLTALKCQELAKKDHLIFLCGHYEGIDERALEKEVHEEISIGDYVLTNGCLAALVVIDAMIRFVPGVLGNEEAALQDSFQEGIFDAPHYTRPVVFEGLGVPDVLMTGHHENIAFWRKERAEEKTRRVRPDMDFKDKES
ncbi:MAG: tRNA (guanosine(37)-N1)-methyltransferase TrmD [Candidatus Rhabdochlamydia sp.]